MQRIVPNLWFDTQAEEAAAFYTSIFPNSRITSVVPYTEAAPGPTGSAMVVNFELDGQAFTGINGGPQFPFTEAISLLVSCETQDEVDRAWDALLAGGGQEVQCGWLKDKYGVSWQVVPAGMDELIQDGDPERVDNVVKAMLQMVKLDIDTLRKAYDAPTGGG